MARQRTRLARRTVGGRTVPTVTGFTWNRKTFLQDKDKFKKQKDFPGILIDIRDKNPFLACSHLKFLWDHVCLLSIRLFDVQVSQKDNLSA